MIRKLNMVNAMIVPKSNWTMTFITPISIAITNVPITNVATIMVTRPPGLMSEDWLPISAGFNLAPQFLQYVKPCATAIPQDEQYTRLPPERLYDGGLF
jgi:hypothetical protein